MDSPVIYNLFPRLVGNMEQWPAHGERVKAMGFNWIFINPIQYPGFSGSLYAVKDFYKLNPLFIPAGADDPMLALRRTIDALHDMDLRVMMDLVINHTSKDSPLIRAHPGWFRRDPDGGVKSPSAIDPADARKVTVWGDLAEVDNAHAPDRQNLWAYWTAMVQFYLDLGLDGFRCDAAYKVPAQLWDQLIGQARKRNPSIVVAAETLGCRLEEVRKLQSAGFDFLFNSSKWWNFDAPWCLRQHAEFGQIAPSISFPESHDTPRLMHETGGLIQVQKLRYAFAALFSAGVLMPVGYEFGFTKKLDVVRTMPEHWEDTSCDLSDFIGSVNRIKRSVPALGVEGRWELCSTFDQPTIVLQKTADDRADAPAVLVLINKDWHQRQVCDLPDMEGPARMLRLFEDSEPTPMPTGKRVELQPAEILLLLPTV